jgi:hypothetical protein
VVVTSGGLPPNPAELLGSAKMDQILSEFHKRVEVVIIDTPPSLVADAQILAGKVDAVLLVIQPGKTHAEAARACLETLHRSGARIVGVVMNRIPRNRSYYYGGYKYYVSQDKGYYSSGKAEPAIKEPARKPAEQPVQRPAARGEQAPAQLPAAEKEPAPGALQKLLQSRTELPAARQEPDTRPSPRGATPEPETTYADESYLTAPSVHRLFDNLDVAPNAAPSQVKPPDNPDSFFNWALPRDQPGD